MFRVRRGSIFRREAEVMIVIRLLGLGWLWGDWLWMCWRMIRVSVWRRTLISEVNQVLSMTGWGGFKTECDKFLLDFLLSLAQSF